MVRLFVTISLSGRAICCSDHVCRTMSGSNHVPGGELCRITGNDVIRGRRWLRDQSRSRLQDQGAVTMPSAVIIHLSSTAQRLQEVHMENAWTAIAAARRALKDNPMPDTFMGRKTQEPFPVEKTSRTGRKS